MCCCCCTDGGRPEQSAAAGDATGGTSGGGGGTGRRGCDRGVASGGAAGGGAGKCGCNRSTLACTCSFHCEMLFVGAASGEVVWHLWVQQLHKCLGDGFHTITVCT
eukprot:1138819-Pelagomonas_calceolata.AAC.1